MKFYFVLLLTIQVLARIAQLV